MNNISILYVEDEKDIRDILSQIIKKFCKNLYIASNGEEGLALYKKHPVDIVISDIIMPKCNGIEMLEEMKKINPQQHVIFTTANLESDYFFRAIELQVSAYVTKPVEIKKLKNAIDRCVHELEVTRTREKLFESEERFRKISKTTQMGIFIYKKKFVYVNEAFCRMLGYTEEEMLALAPWKLLELTQRDNIKKIIKKRLAGEEFPERYDDLHFITKNGDIKVVRVSTETIIYEKQYAGLGTAVDITDLMGIEERLQLLAQAMEQMDEMVRITDVNGKITYVNEALTQHTQYSKKELIGQSNRIFKSFKQTPEFYKDLWATILSKKSYKAILINKKKNGDLFYEDQTITPILDEKENIKYFVSTSRDVTQQRELEEQLKNLATVDYLTGIANRYQMNKKIDEEIRRVQRFNSSFALVMFDLDYFKKVNDIYGHDVGDIILKEFSKLIEDNIRDTDKFGRWGGEEFMLFSEQVNVDDIVHFANKLRTLVEDYAFPSVEHITVSIGVAICTQEDTKEQLLKRVDDALYEAKESGRNMVVFQ